MENQIENSQYTIEGKEKWPLVILQYHFFLCTVMYDTLCRRVNRMCV